MRGVYVQSKQTAKGADSTSMEGLRVSYGIQGEEGTVKQKHSSTEGLRVRMVYKKRHKQQ